MPKSIQGAVQLKAAKAYVDATRVCYIGVSVDGFVFILLEGVSDFVLFLNESAEEVIRKIEEARKGGKNHE